MQESPYGLRGRDVGEVESFNAVDDVQAGIGYRDIGDGKAV